MSKSALVTYYFHSGFSVALGEHLLIFDYWRGRNDLPPEKQITEELLMRYQHVYVFVTHEHLDHYDPVIFEWQKNPACPVTYIIADDMPVEPPGSRMAVGDAVTYTDGLRVQAFGSTDLGVSYLCELDGFRIFHAGDLNFWHWQDESTSKEIEDAEALFHAEIERLSGQKMDLAFFPVDPRQGSMYDAGANYFNMSLKPRIMVPMHYWGRSDIIETFSRAGKTAETTIIPLTRMGESMRVTKRDDGSIDVELLMPPTPVRREMPPAETYEPTEDEDGIFSDTDLPVNIND